MREMVVKALQHQYGFISALSSDGFTVSAGSSNASVVNQNGG